MLNTSHKLAHILFNFYNRKQFNFFHFSSRNGKAKSRPGDFATWVRLRAVIFALREGANGCNRDPGRGRKERRERTRVQVLHRDKNAGAIIAPTIYLVFSDV